MKKLVTTCVLTLAMALGAAANAQATATPHSMHINNGNAWFMEPLIPIDTNNPVTSVEGLVSYDDGSLDKAYGILNGNIFQKEGTAPDQSDWERTWGYVAHSAIDVSANAGMAWAITDTNRVLYKSNDGLDWSQMEPPSYKGELKKIDVDGDGNPWVIAHVEHEEYPGWYTNDLFRLDDSGNWEKVVLGSVNIHASYEIDPIDVAASDDGVVLVTYASTGAPHSSYDCVIAIDAEDPATKEDPADILDSHCAYGGLLPGDKLPPTRWHMLGPIDIDANGVMWAAVEYFWTTAQDVVKSKAGLYKVQAIDADGNIDLTVNADNIFFYEATINDVGAQ